LASSKDSFDLWNIQHPAPGIVRGPIRNLTQDSPNNPYPAGDPSFAFAGEKQCSSREQFADGNALVSFANGSVLIWKVIRPRGVDASGSGCTRERERLNGFASAQLHSKSAIARHLMQSNRRKLNRPFRRHGASGQGPGEGNP
jgi:hypothetical protein